MPRSRAEAIAPMKTSVSARMRAERAGIETAQNQQRAADDFQPRKIKRHPHAERPRDGVIVRNIIGELERMYRLHHSGVNENPADNEIENAPEELQS